MAHRYDEKSVVANLKRHSGISISNAGVIDVLIDAQDVGIHTWGKIDYLIHYCGYVLHRVKAISGKKSVFAETNDKPKISKAEKNEMKKQFSPKLNLKKK